MPKHFSERGGRTGRGAWIAIGTTAMLLGLMPLVLSEYPLLILCYVLVFALACLGLNLLFGIAGLLSLGHAAYFGIGGYAGAFLYRFYDLDSLELHLLAGDLAATTLATAFGFLCTQTTNIHFTILSLALAQIVHALFINGAVFELFGGVGRALFYLGGGGLYIPRLTILGVQYAPGDFIPAFYYVALTAVLCSGLVRWRIDRSPFGSALKAIWDNEQRAAFIGIPVRRYHWFAFVVSAAFVALAGGLTRPTHYGSRAQCPGVIYELICRRSRKLNQ